jgi:uncharacterized protein (TIGR03067 family)
MPSVAGDITMPTRLLLGLAPALFCAGAALLPAVAQDKGDPAKTDADLLQGTWNYVVVEQNGVKEPRRKPGEDLKTITFQGDKFEVKRGDTVLQAGTRKLEPAQKPKTIDLTITEGDGKGTVQLGIYELKGDTFTACLDSLGKKRPTTLESKGGGGYILAELQRERKAGIDPMDASIVYDEPWQTVSGFKAYNGKAYDKVALCVEPKAKIVLPEKATMVEEHDQAGVLLVYMEKRADIHAHFPRAVSVADYRKTMGCAVKLEKGALLIGTFGEFSFLEGAVSMRLLVLVPPKVEVERRAGLSGGYGGRGGSDRPKNAINPTRDDPKPALTKTREGMPGCWLPPTAEDGWHEIPAAADVDRRMSKGDKKG